MAGQPQPLAGLQSTRRQVNSSHQGAAFDSGERGRYSGTAEELAEALLPDEGQPSIFFRYRDTTFGTIDIKTLVAATPMLRRLAGVYGSLIFSQSVVEEALLLVYERRKHVWTNLAEDQADKWKVAMAVRIRAACRDVAWERLARPWPAWLIKLLDSYGEAAEEVTQDPESDEFEGVWERNVLDASLFAVPSAAEWTVGFFYATRRAYRDRFIMIDGLRRCVREYAVAPLYAAAGAKPQDNVKVRFCDGAIYGLPGVFVKNLEFLTRKPCAGSIGITRDFKEVAVRHLKDQDRTPICVILVNGEHKLEVSYEQVGGDRDIAEAVALELARLVVDGAIRARDLEWHRDWRLVAQGFAAPRLSAAASSSAATQNVTAEDNQADAARVELENEEGAIETAARRRRKDMVVTTTAGAERGLGAEDGAGAEDGVERHARDVRQKKWVTLSLACQAPRR
jgi:hypothetical protein